MRRMAPALFLALMVATSIYLTAAAPSTQVIQGPEVEQFLRKARFVTREPLGSGVTGSFKVTLELVRRAGRMGSVHEVLDQDRRVAGVVSGERLP